METNFTEFLFVNSTLEDLLKQFNLTSLYLRQDISSSEKAFKITLYVMAMLVAIVGNLLLIIVILRTQSLRTKFNYYVLNLAFVDLFVPGTCMWLHLVQYLDQDQWTMGPFFCRIKTFIQGNFGCNILLNNYSLLYSNLIVGM